MTGTQVIGQSLAAFEALQCEVGSQRGCKIQTQALWYEIWDSQAAVYPRCHKLLPRTLRSCNFLNQFSSLENGNNVMIIIKIKWEVGTWHSG